jgi:hypothetical protein
VEAISVVADSARAAAEAVDQAGTTLGGPGLARANHGEADLVLTSLALSGQAPRNLVLTSLALSGQAPRNLVLTSLALEEVALAEVALGEAAPGEDPLDTMEVDTMEAIVDTTVAVAVVAVAVALVAVAAAALTPTGRALAAQAATGAESPTHTNPAQEGRAPPEVAQGDLGEADPTGPLADSAAATATTGATATDTSVDVDLAQGEAAPGGAARTADTPPATTLLVQTHLAVPT